MTNTPQAILEAALRQMIREEVLAVLAEVEPVAPVAPVPPVRKYDGPRSLTPAEVAEKAGFAAQTLANWRGLGEGPAFYKIGRLVRYDEAVLEEWLNACRTEGTELC